MKKVNLLLVSFVLLSVVFSGCKKEKEGVAPTGPEKAPTSYSQKVVLEYFSGAWCTFCPDGIVYSDKVQNAVGSNNFINYVIHSNDKMSFDKGNTLINLFKPAYPTGMVNRVDGKAANRTTWEATANIVKTQTAKCGFKIDASQKEGDKYKVNVTLGIGAIDLPATQGKYFITVVAVAKELSGTGTGWDQVNYYNTQNGHPFYQKGNPIVGYKHKNVAFDILTSATGDAIPTENLVAGKLSNYEFTLDLKGQPASNMEVVAIISEFHDDISKTGIEASYVLNGAKVNVGDKKGFE
ncbi:MAG: Omp28-related outer membrane protein [Bacteroidota bacterium]|nr:Omp28-related outer membrane protein [Bacteroidota bacterium]